jgi:hypothetical protein
VAVELPYHTLPFGGLIVPSGWSANHSPAEQISETKGQFPEPRTAGVPRFEGLQRATSREGI